MKMRRVEKKERLRRMNRDLIAYYKVAFVVSLGLELACKKERKKCVCVVVVVILDSFSSLCSTINRLQTCGEKRASVFQLIRLLGN